jgi:hypothetical protein
MSEEVDSFASMFSGPPGAQQRERRIERERKERRTQLTEAQRKRSAVRTAQINFRCSEAFKTRLKEIVDLEGRGSSMADVLEEALEMFAKARGYGSHS